MHAHTGMALDYNQLVHVWQEQHMSIPLTVMLKLPYFTFLPYYCMYVYVSITHIYTQEKGECLFIFDG